MNNRWIAALTLALAFAASATASTPTPAPGVSEQLITMRLYGKITIDPQGQVHEYHIDSKMPKEVEELLAKAIPKWRFEPVLVDGKPALAQSPMRVVVAAKAERNHYVLRIDNVLFRPNTKEDFAAERAAERVAEPRATRVEALEMAPPVYASKLQNAGIEGIVLVVVKIELDGTVSDAIVSQTSLFNVTGRPSDLERARAQLERSTLAAARAWRFKVHPSEADALAGKAQLRRVPVEYYRGSLSKGDGFAGSWRHEFRSPYQKSPGGGEKKEDGGEVIGASDVASGEMISGTPKLRLLDRDQVLGSP